MKKTILFLMLIMTISAAVFAADFAEIDKWFDDAKFDKAYTALITEYNADKTQAAVIWRLG